VTKRRDTRAAVETEVDPASDAATEVESTPERLLDVAERLFAQKGFAGTAVRDIAREAGLTAPSLYNHFEGKQALYEAVLARGVQPLIDLMSGLATDGDGDAGALLDAIMDHLAAHPDLARLIQYESLIGGASLSRVAQGWLRPIVDQGMRAMERNPDTVWTDEEQPFAVAAWIHMILGHFAMAPLLRELFDFDPLAPAEIERQKRFLRRYARLVMSGRDPLGDDPSG
jgi:AcrR family transcriptional regulator